MCRRRTTPDVVTLTASRSRKSLRAVACRDVLPNSKKDSDEEGLQRGPEGGDGRKPMLLEGLLQMCQCELNWAVRDDLGRLAQSNERRTDGGLSVEKSSPDSIGG